MTAKKKKEISLEDAKCEQIGDKLRMYTFDPDSDDERECANSSHGCHKHLRKLLVGEEISKDFALKIVSHIDSTLRKGRMERTNKLEGKNQFIDDIKEISDFLEIHDSVGGDSPDLTPKTEELEEEVGEDGQKKKRKKNRRKKKRIKKLQMQQKEQNSMNRRKCSCKS